MFRTPRQDSQQEQELPQETMFSLTKYVGFFFFQEFSGLLPVLHSSQHHG